MKISLIIPMYNESSIIADAAKTLSEYMSKTFDEYEIIFCNDGSSDNCGDIVRDLNLPCVRVEGYTENHGKGYAVRYGVSKADGDIIMFTDADLAYGTDVIKRFYDFYAENSKNEEIHLMIGSRNLEGDGYKEYTFIRRLASKTYIWVLCHMGGFKLSDSQCGCKAFRGDAAHEIFSRCTVDRFAFDFEVILWAEKLGYTIKEIPVKIINHRESKVNVFKDTFRMLRDLRRIKKNVKKASK